MIGDLAIIGIGAAVQQEACQLRMMGNTGRAVESAFERGIGLMIIVIETGVGIGSGVEEGGGRSDKAVGSGAIEPEIFRETKMCESVPTARFAFGCGVRGVESEEAADGRGVAQDCGCVDVGGSDLGVCG